MTIRTIDHSDQWNDFRTNDPSDYRPVGLLTIRTSARFSDQWTVGPTTIRNIELSPQVHLHERRHACPVCGFAFYGLPDLRRHLHNKHGKSDKDVELGLADDYNCDTGSSWICFPFIGEQSLYPDSKVHGANIRPTWVLSAPDGPHVCPMNLAIRVVTKR